MAIKIDGKITGYQVVKEDEAAAAAEQEITNNVIHMHEKLERPETLRGSTYKIKTPLSEHAMYLTINDLILNEGTDHEKWRPFEIFINSKSMDHFQWVVALTRVVSAVFRKGGDVTFLVEELQSVFDPRGGYFKKGKYVPSLVAEIGNVIETHMKTIGLLANDELDEHQKKLLEEKRAQLESSRTDTAASDSQDSEFPPEAQLCNKCMTKAVVKLDGCMTCLNCADSKCG